MATVNPETFTADELVHGPTKLNRRGMNVTPIYHRKADGTMESFIFQITQSRTPFGISCYPPPPVPAGENPKYTLTHVVEEDSALEQMYDIIDNLNLEYAYAHSKEMFRGKQHTMEDLRAYYKPLKQVSVDGKYPPNTRCKLTSDGTEIKVPCFDINRKQVPIEKYITAGGTATTLVQLVSLYEMPKMWGGTQIALQTMGYPRAQYDTFMMDDGNAGPCEDDCETQPMF